MLPSDVDIRYLHWPRIEVHYLQTMSRQGEWADHIIIQAVANVNNLRIHITESARNFTETTVVTSVYAQSPESVRHIYIGHLDELDYLSTSPIAQSASEQIHENQLTDKQISHPQNLQSNRSQLSENSASMKHSQNRKEYMMTYMRKRRLHNEFEKKESVRKKSYNKKYKNSNPTKIKESWQKTTRRY